MNLTKSEQARADALNPCPACAGSGKRNSTTSYAYRARRPRQTRCVDCDGAGVRPPDCLCGHELRSHRRGYLSGACRRCGCAGYRQEPLARRQFDAERSRRDLWGYTMDYLHEWALGMDTERK